MERWSKSKQIMIEVDAIDKFLAEISAVCKKHKLSIGHEDGHGSFMIEPYSEENIDWLMNATEDTERD